MSVAFSLYYLDKASSLWLNCLTALQLTRLHVPSLHRLRVFLSLDQFDYLLIAAWPMLECVLLLTVPEPLATAIRTCIGELFPLLVSWSLLHCYIINVVQSSLILAKQCNSLRLNPQYLMVDASSVTCIQVREMDSDAIICPPVQLEEGISWFICSLFGGYPMDVCLWIMFHRHCRVLKSSVKLN